MIHSSPQEHVGRRSGALFRPRQSKRATHHFPSAGAASLSKDDVAQEHVCESPDSVRHEATLVGVFVPLTSVWALHTQQPLRGSGRD